jgi:hypothetical protein
MLVCQEIGGLLSFPLPKGAEWAIKGSSMDTPLLDPFRGAVTYYKDGVCCHSVLL